MIHLHLHCMIWALLCVDLYIISLNNKPLTELFALFQRLLQDTLIIFITTDKYGVWIYCQSSYNQYFYIDNSLGLMSTVYEKSRL